MRVTPFSAYFTSLNWNIPEYTTLLLNTYVTVVKYANENQFESYPRLNYIEMEQVKKRLDVHIYLRDIEIKRKTKLNLLSI